MTPEEVRAIERADRYVMPWGKYKGKRMEKLPSSYLLWIAENVKDDMICTNADIIYRYREGTGEHFEEEDIL